MRIGIARIWQETNTFSPEETTLEHFRRNGLYRDKEVLASAAQLPEVAGAVEAVNLYAQDVELVPLIAAMAWPAGKLTAETCEYLKNMLIERLDEASDLDGLFFSMHGALAAEDCDDVEGDLLLLVRERLGHALPISVSLDMHANITAAMIRLSDCIVGYHTCPHVDVEETGHRAMKMLLAAASSKIEPKLAWRKIPMVVPADRHNHLEGPLSELAAEVEKIEQLPKVVSASVFAVQPWLDVQELGWTTVVITDGDSQLAQQLTDTLADQCWQRRSEFFVDKMTPEEAVREALGTKGRPVVISDSADSTNSGSPGNSTWLLKEILQAGTDEPVFLTMVAPEVAQKAHQAGVGAQMDVEFGTSPVNPYSQSLEVNVRVESLHDGKMALSGHIGKNVVVHMGKTAVLVAENIKIVTSEAVGPGHVPPAFFEQLGLEVMDAKIIVAKSPVGFRASYESIAAGIILCEAPGPACSDLLSLDYHKRPKPLYPFKPEMDWSAIHKQKVPK